MTGLIAFPSYARWVVFGLVCYGGLIEVLQSMLTTTRHGDVVDWAADSLGIVVGLGAYLVSQKFVKNAINNIAD
jgi:VanZ family protein